MTNVVSGFASSTNYYNNQGLLVSVTNAFGRALSTAYDILDRATNSVDGNGVTLNNTYDNLNRLLMRTYPDTGQEKFVYTLNIGGLTSYTNQIGSNVVNYAYDALGRKTNEVNPGTTTNNYAYSAASDLLTLADGKGQTTRWNYDLYGRMTNKVDAAIAEIFRYQYDAESRLTNRWSAGKGNTTYKYDPVGNLTNVVYPVSPALTMKYDALKRLTNMVDTVGTTVYTYANQFLASEDGPWANDTVSYTYTNRLRGGLTLLQPNAASWSQTYGYDAANRLQSLSSQAGASTYTYKGPGNLVTNLALPNGAAITNAFDSVARLTGTRLKKNDGTVLNSHTYGYSLAAQRTSVTNFTGNFVNYTYDNIGELKTAVGKESGGSLRLQEQFGYAYDAAGNLNYRTNNALVQAFGVNNLNGLTAATRTGTLTVAGTTTATATNVTVADNGNSPVSASLYADRTFARTNVTVLNGNNTFSAIAQGSYDRTDTNSVTVNLPASVSYIYDSNGNLTSDGTRGFDYDDENQVIRVTVTNSCKSEFTYDGKFRRRVRKEYTWQSSVWAQTAEVHYLYDGMVVIQERDVNNLPTVTYTRGRDSSASLQGAGGIGGLLARTDAGNGQSAFYHADGNGNVTAMVNAQQIVVAKYTYDPFGNTLANSGPLADANIYRFSSQEYHQNSGLVLFLYRAYDPNLQRWLNRDPIEEMGGANLYGFVGNNPMMRLDPVGLDWTDYIPNWVGGLVSYNGPTYSPALPIPDRIPTAINGGKQNLFQFVDYDAGSRENVFSDFKDQFHEVKNGVGKELAVGGAMLLIPEEEMLGVVGEGLAKLKALKTCEKLAKQFKRLSSGEIKKLNEAGINPHDLKPNSKFDLFKDKDGNIFVKPKDGAGPGDPTGININNP